jgi:Flp pilus assembly protein TadG
MNSKSNQRGAAALEFALVAVVLFTVLMAVFELGRIMFFWNSAVHATTVAARWSAVCDGTDVDPAPSVPVATRVDRILPGLSDSGALRIDYLGTNGGTNCAGTAASPCYRVRASLSSSLLAESFSTPLLTRVVNIPSFTTTVTSEGLMPVGQASFYPACAG